MRLTKSIKKDMHHALMVHSGLYDEKSMKEQALKEQGDVCYHKALARYLDVMKLFPEDTFSTRESLTLIIEGEYKYIELTGYKPIILHWGAVEEDYHDLHPDSEEYLEYLKRKQELKDTQTKIDQAKQEAWSVLNSVNTYKQLCEVWADAIPVVSKFYKPKGGALMLVNIPKVNRTFGLPPKTNP